MQQCVKGTRAVCDGRLEMIRAARKDEFETRRSIFLLREKKVRSFDRTTGNERGRHQGVTGPFPDKCVFDSLKVRTIWL